MNRMNEKILIVEDDESIASILIEHLRADGYIVNWASNGSEGLKDFKMESYKLLILDIMMPGMDGFTLCENIRLVNEDVPVIFISAKHEAVDKVKGLNIGADDYITKPFSLSELSARVGAQLRRYRRREGNIGNNQIEFKDGLTINIEEKKIMLYENEIQLTGKEFDLLVLMAKNQGKIFAKSELYQNVWQIMDLEDNNTVTVHIKAIREKLKIT